MSTSLSRIGRKPVEIAQGVQVQIQSQKISVKGPKGQLEMNIHPYVKVTMENNQIKVHPNTETDEKITGPNKKLYRSITGTMRAKIQNLVTGVSVGFEEKMALVGVGYRAQAKGKVLELKVGCSHPTDYKLPEGVTVETPTQTEISLKSTSKEYVGQAAAEIREYRAPEPYKGKGIRYAGEVIELKETKKK